MAFPQVTRTQRRSRLVLAVIGILVMVTCALIAISVAPTPKAQCTKFDGLLLRFEHTGGRGSLRYVVLDTSVDELRLRLTVAL
jgi:hypothetical protein